MPYNTEREEISWEACSLRTRLNATFLENAFSQEEQVRILSVTAPADSNSKFETTLGNDTEDKVFLLSIAEANQYFSSDKTLAAIVTTDGSIDESGYTIYSDNCAIRPAMWIEITK